MKRSEVNQLLKDAVDFVHQMGFKLPPYAFWYPKDWETKGPDYDEIRENMLGWDITDFGSGDFYHQGLTLFTLRNGKFNNPKYPKTYCEKLLIVLEEQVTPLHYHSFKIEDIINRGGGNLMMRVYNADAKNELADTDVEIHSDGRHYTVPAGTTLRLTPGESVTLMPRCYHDFWAEKESGKVIVTEVSMTNDDATDNHFLTAPGRFPTIIEDEPPICLLCTEYPPARR